MTGRALVIGGAVWLVAATVVGLFTGRCLKLMHDEEDQ